ncbi:MAG TPA: DUF2304 family protein, partial [bacterium]|nr:DUF2304 family protein [bacterium]
MLQQAIALAFIAIFIWRLSQQKKKKQIGNNEFILWLAVWLIGALAIIFIRSLDKILVSLGFSGSGINFLLYLAVISLFYLVFKLRLKISKLEKNVQITRNILENKKTGPCRDIVLLNAAAALMISGQAPGFAEGIRKANDCIDS